MITSTAVNRPTIPGHWVHRADIEAAAIRSYRQHDLAGARTLPALVGQVAQLHGKPIGLTAISDFAWDTLTALWVDYPDRAQIFYRAADSPLYQTHCILHELAHIALQHPGCNVLPQEQDLTEYTNGGGAIRGRLLATDSLEVPNLAATPRQVVEGEAEHLAHLLSASLFRPTFSVDEDLFG